MSVSSREPQRQLDDLKQDQEQKIAKIRADYQKKEAEAHETGAAAVSHIRRANEERAEQARADGEDRVKRESDQVSRTYNDLKRRVAQQNEVLDRQVQTAEEHAHARMASAREDETKAMRQTQNKLREFMETQRELKDQARSSTDHDVEEIRRKGNEQVQQAKAQNFEKVRKTEMTDKQTIEDLKERNKAVYADTKTQADRRIEELRHDSNLKLENERIEKNRSLTDLQQKYHDAVTNEQRDGDRRLNAQIKKDEDRFRDVRDRALRKNEETQATYSIEGQRVQTAGEADVHERQEKFEELKKTQEQTNHHRLKQLEESLTEQETQARKASQTRAQFEAKKLDETLHEKRSEFKTRYDQNDKTYKESLHNQKEGFLKALYKQKQKIDARFGVEKARESDPFYRLKTFDGDLSEEPGSYVLRAKVAPHEKDSVDIIVKDDRITLSAKRAFADSFTSDFGDRTTTNTYQTYRQDYTLGAPITPHLAYKRIDDDGTITVIAPKKGWESHFKPPISKA